MIVEGPCLVRIDDRTVAGGERNAHILIAVGIIGRSGSERAELLDILLQILNSILRLQFLGGGVNSTAALAGLEEITQLLCGFVVFDLEADGLLLEGKHFALIGVKGLDLGVLRLGVDLFRDLLSGGLAACLVDSQRDFISLFAALDALLLRIGLGVAEDLIGIEAIGEVLFCQGDLLSARTDIDADLFRQPIFHRSEGGLSLLNGHAAELDTADSNVIGEVG